MPPRLFFRPYTIADKDICLTVFDANCPRFFALTERVDYERFLDSNPVGYELCERDGDVVGAYGLIGDGSVWRSLNWIMLLPEAQGVGIGSAIMDRVINLGKVAGLNRIDIAASHLSAPFFEKFGAVALSKLDNGWGPGLHRIEMEIKLE